MTTQEKPTIITLSNDNALPILVKYVEISQSKGTFNISEADILKRSIDVAVRGIKDADIDIIQAKSLLIQAIHKGQSHGDYTLNDASLLLNTISFINAQPGEYNVVPNKSNVTMEVTPEHIVGDGKDGDEDEDDDDFDLSELSEAIPFKPREI